MNLITEDWHAGAVVEASWVRAEAASFPRHTHDEYVLGTNLTGVEHIWLDGRSLEAPAGSITLYNPNAMQASQFSPQGVEYISLHLAPHAIDRVVRDNNLAGNTFEQGVFHHAALHQAILDFARTPTGQRAEHEEAFIGLLCQWMQPGPGKSGEQHASVQRCMAYLRDCLGEKIDLQALAAVAGLSKYHFVRCFKKQTGLGPLQYQMQLRLLEARKRLRRQQHSLEIVSELGFYDQSHFINAFRKVMGVTPHAYAQAFKTKARG
ncbi:AraC family transcriptional regulator [Pseudomonas sp. M47T1]|uniref:helix-turn-helix transcriptional regulator n=1 Tax=Pseudomonas sp. M47T1 TaxID=1179778 RepID=UPI0002606AFF|nr:AraC family transcriptional regulator [Pseudomonas sp. M47T1]EIK98275.1 AraC family transcriptional regulator [Pseudomonas sp. M47T1]